MSGVVIRRAAVPDAPSVQTLVRRSYAVYRTRMNRPPAPVNQDYSEVLGETVSWLAEADNALVGVIVSRFYADHLLIENVAVLPSAQGHGVGTQLLKVAEDHALAHGVHEIRLYTNEAMTENLVFYPRRGYREIGRAEQDGYRRVFFRKVIPITE
jgi:GNAT superfamily N-acetyltransferase